MFIKIFSGKSMNCEKSRLGRFEISTTDYNIDGSYNKKK